MSWDDLVENLAGAVGGSKRPSAGTARPAPRVERIEHDEVEVYDSARIAEIELETRVQMDRAARETAREMSRAETAARDEGAGRTESRANDFESGVEDKLDELRRAVEGRESDRRAVRRVERRLTWLLGLAVVAVALGMVALYAALAAR